MSPLVPLILPWNCVNSGLQGLTVPSFWFINLIASKVCLQASTLRIKIPNSFKWCSRPSKTLSPHISLTLPFQHTLYYSILGILQPKGYPHVSGSWCILCPSASLFFSSSSLPGRLVHLINSYFYSSLSVKPIIFRGRGGNFTNLLR